MKNISLRISDREKQHFDEYCRITERTQSDVLREYIRSLSVSGMLNPIDRPIFLSKPALSEAEGLNQRLQREAPMEDS
jgi:hypothetical protein